MDEFATFLLVLIIVFAVGGTLALFIAWVKEGRP